MDRAIQPLKRSWRNRRRSRNIFFGLILGPVLLGACDLPTVPARTGDRAPYDFTLDQTELVMRWPEGAVVRVFAVPGPDTERTKLLADGLAHGIGVWNDITLYDEFRLEIADRVHEADVVIGWSDGEFPIETADCEPGTDGRAVTTFCPHPDDPTRLRPFPIRTPAGLEFGRPRIVIVIRAGQAESPEMVPRLVAHELGHALGIGQHSPDANDLMWRGTLLADEPTAADVATIRTLYRTSPNILP